MGTRSMSASVAPLLPASPDSWKLAADVAGDVQGIVVSGYGDLVKAKGYFLDCSGAPGGNWLAELRAVAPITAADGAQQPAAMIAFTVTGLHWLGVPKVARDSFQLPFQEGMLLPDRRKRLGDAIVPGDPSTISPGGLAWSANTKDQLNAAGGTPTGVHALLVLYEADDAALDRHAKAVEAVLIGAGVGLARVMELDLRVDNRAFPREHFGFTDGVSQPIPFGEKVLASTPGADPCHGVALGDILLGYTNAHGEVPPGPIVPEPVAVDSKKLVATNAPAPKPDDGVGALPKIEGTDGLRDLGRNGSYLVVRELRQDVAAFWSSMEREASDLNQRAGAGAPPVNADWLAERVVGRNKDGHLLGASGPYPPIANGCPDNTPLFFKTDQFGFGCPIGSHVRRGNPRDGLAKDAGDCGDLLKAANAHRILRRGRKFGPDATVDANGKVVPDGQDRGLLFMCLNTDIVRQFEFVQQNWLLNPNFATLFKEVDPLLGPKGKMTLPREPLRRTVDVETYVTLTGGDYFFLPGLKALDYFEMLTGPSAEDHP